MGGGMNEQPEALRLADIVERNSMFNETAQEAAAELRRLHQFAEDLIGRATAAEAALQMTKTTRALKIAAVEAQRDALLEALKEAVEICIWPSTAFSNAFDKARAAIAKAEEA